MEKNYQICKRCVMDTSEPTISFDSNGVCSHCTCYLNRIKNECPDSRKAEFLLKKHVEQIKHSGKGKEYDCIIGLSGGVDSTYVALNVVKLGLRPLAIHLDNGWNDELAVHNIERTCNKLGIDLYTHVINWEEFRDIQLSYLKASVPNIEVPTDHAISAILFRMASHYNIRFVISGGNVMTEGIPMNGWMYDSRDLKNLIAIHKRFGTYPIKTLPTSSLINYAWYLLLKRVKYLPLLNYLSYNKENAKTEIIQELKWRDYGGKHYESIFTRFFQAYILPKKFNIDKRRPHLSALVCSNQMSRDEAIKRLSQSPYPNIEMEKNDYEFFLKKMQLNSHDFEKIMAMPPRTHEYYPSNSWFYIGMRKHINGIVKKFVKP